MITPNNPRNTHNPILTPEETRRRGSVGLGIGTVLLVLAIVMLVSQNFAIGLVLLVPAVVLVAVGGVAQRGSERQP